MQRARLAAAALGAAAATILVDQLSKLAILRWWPDLVSYNTGAAFSLPVPPGVVVLIFIVLTLTVLFSWQDLQRAGVRANVAVGLVVGGAISNLIDRAVRGAVLDFIDLRIWPVFNLADAALVVGTVGVLWYAWRSSRREHTSPNRGRGQAPGRNTNRSSSTERS